MFIVNERLQNMKRNAYELYLTAKLYFKRCIVIIGLIPIKVCVELKQSVVQLLNYMISNKVIRLINTADTVYNRLHQNYNIVVTELQQVVIKLHTNTFIVTSLQQISQ